MVWYNEEDINRNERVTNTYFLLFFIFGFVIAVLFTIMVGYILVDIYRVEVEELGIELSVYNNNFIEPDPIFTNVVDINILIKEGEEANYSNRSYFINDGTRGMSMYPTIFENSTLFCLTDFTKEELQVGKMIVFQFLNQLTLHRIINIQNNTYITKGDNNIYDDGEVEFRQVKCLVGGILF